MRALAALCCVFAAGCSTSLGISVPGASRYEAREARPPTDAAPVNRVTLELDRSALSLTAAAYSRKETQRTGDFRRVQPVLTYGIPYSFLLGHAELVVAAALVPALVPVLLYQAAWWVWSRGLSDEERAELGDPFGSGYRNMSLQALWPGCNVTAWWWFRAELLELDDPTAGAWRTRSVIDTEPIRGAVKLEVKTGEGAPRSLSASAGPGGTARFDLAELAPADDATVVLTATSGAGTATLELPAGYWRAATDAAALRAKLAAEPSDGETRAQLAALYEAAGGFALARAEHERLHVPGTAWATADVERLWNLEAGARRRDGRLHAALFADAARRLERRLRTGEVSREPLATAPEAAAGRITHGLLHERVDNALAWAESADAPPAVIGNALLSTAGDFTAPAAAWAALRACIAHPQPLAGETLPNLLRAGVPVELQRLAAQAILAGSPGSAVAVLAPHAALPGVHWALNDATGARLPAQPEAWASWAETQAWTLQWDATARRYSQPRDR